MISSAYRAHRVNQSLLTDTLYCHPGMSLYANHTIQPLSIYARTVLTPTLPPFQIEQSENTIVGSPESTRSTDTNQSEQSMTADETVVVSGYKIGRAANREFSAERSSSSSSTITDEISTPIMSNQFFNWESLHVHKPHIYVNENNNELINPTLRKPRKPVSTKRSRAIENLLDCVSYNTGNADVSAVGEIFQHLVSTASLDPLSFQNRSRPTYGKFQGISQQKCHKLSQTQKAATSVNREKNSVAEKVLPSKDKNSKSETTKKGSKKSRPKAGNKSAFKTPEPAKKSTPKRSTVSKGAETVKKTHVKRPSSSKKVSPKRLAPARKSSRRDSRDKQLPPKELAKSMVTKSIAVKPKIKPTTKVPPKKHPAKPRSSSPKIKDSQASSDDFVLSDTSVMLEDSNQNCVQATASASSSAVPAIPSITLKLKPTTQSTQPAHQTRSKVAKPNSKPTINKNSVKGFTEQYYQPILPKPTAPTDQRTTVVGQKMAGN